MIINDNIATLSDNSHVNVRGCFDRCYHVVKELETTIFNGHSFVTGIPKFDVRATLVVIPNIPGVTEFPADIKISVGKYNSSNELIDSYVPTVKPNNGDCTNFSVYAYLVDENKDGFLLNDTERLVVKLHDLVVPKILVALNMVSAAEVYARYLVIRGRTDSKYLHQLEVWKYA